jgi:predicted transcriptional regulator
MNDLIKALQIMLKHGDVKRPTHCEHDELHIYPNNMDFTEDEIKELEELGFLPNDMDGFVSFKYGSC